jgi:hypothetical protein
VGIPILGKRSYQPPLLGLRSIWILSGNKRESLDFFYQERAPTYKTSQHTKQSPALEVKTTCKKWSKMQLDSLEEGKPRHGQQGWSLGEQWE